MISMQDINNDQKLDLLIGNYSGGLSFFSSDSTIINYTPNFILNDLNIFPNPANKFLTIENSISGELLIINSIGKDVLKKYKNEKRINLNLTSLKSGLYLVKLENLSSKLIVK